MTLIFYLSSQQKIAVSDDSLYNFLFFKSLHVIEYGILFFLVFFGVTNNSKKKFPQKLLISLMITFLYACSDEIHQLFVPTREGHMRDVMIDSVGMGIAYLAIKLQEARYKIQKRK